MKALIVRETRPGPGVSEPIAMLAYIRNGVNMSWHMVATCKMGIDDDAVVDLHLHVRGIDGLRVIDSSICPTISSSNTNGPPRHRGKGADMILANVASPQ